MRAVGGSPDQHDAEFDEVRWFSLPEALAMLTYPTERTVVERAAEMLDAPASGPDRAQAEATA